MTFFWFDTSTMCGYVVWRDNFHVTIWTRLEITSVPITFLFVPEVITLFTSAIAVVEMATVKRLR